MTGSGNETFAATSRRRWISIAELVALVGVVIAALGLWNSWMDRRDAHAARAANEAAMAHDRSRVDLTATPRKDGLLLADAHHDIQDVTITFPTALGVTAQQPLADPVIEAEPLRDALLHGQDLHAGRLPVLITTQIVDGDAGRTVAAIYDVVWLSDRHLLGIGKRGLKLDGLRLRQRGGSQAALDALWAREKAAPAS